MPDPPWRRELHRCFRRTFHTKAGRWKECPSHRSYVFSPVFVTLLIALLVAGSVICLLEMRLGPIVQEVAAFQIRNHFTEVLERSISDALGEEGPRDESFIIIQRDESGTITSLTTDMVYINQIRGQLISRILENLAYVDVSVVQIPLGSLLNSEFFWARGPTLKARAMSVGTVSAEFESQLSSAGVNQTLHRIWLDVEVPITVILPGVKVTSNVHTDFCVAETVIVGRVPETLLTLGDKSR